MGGLFLCHVCIWLLHNVAAASPGALVKTKLFKLSLQNYKGSIPSLCSVLSAEPLSLASQPSWFFQLLDFFLPCRDPFQSECSSPLSPQSAALGNSSSSFRSKASFLWMSLARASHGHILLLHRTRCLLPVIVGLHCSHTESKWQRDVCAPLCL